MTQRLVDQCQIIKIKCDCFHEQNDELYTSSLEFDS